MVPAARHLGIGLIPYSPLRAGLLTGALQAADDGRLSAEQQDRVTAHRDQLQAYEDLCRDIGAPASVALAGHLRNPAVSATIMGAMTIQELYANPGALSVHLSDDVLQRLDEIWPGPLPQNCPAADSAGEQAGRKRPAVLSHRKSNDVRDSASALGPSFPLCASASQWIGGAKIE